MRKHLLRIGGVRCSADKLGLPDDRSRFSWAWSVLFCGDKGTTKRRSAAAFGALDGPSMLLVGITVIIPVH